MWKLTEIYAQNICSFRQLNYKITQGVTTLIFGDNRDNESQQSNGSGKSALIECIAVGISGSPLRKVKNEEIINDNSEECLIELSFSNDSTNEVFKVERRLYRKGSSEVCCYTIQPDHKIKETSQPSVDAYNKYILERLGITKEELYNNFILSKHKYQDFLSCSDKEKKEIINRFSNGNMVDQAIDKILEDKNPLIELQKKTDLEYAGLEGRINVLTEQIEKEENQKDEREQSKAEKINSLKNQILDKRVMLNDIGDSFNFLTINLDQIKEVDTIIQNLENSDLTLEDCLSQIEKNILLIDKQPNMSDWNGILNRKKEEISTAEEKLKEWDLIFKEAEKKVISISMEYNRLKTDYKAFESISAEQQKAYDSELLRLDDDYKRVNTEIDRIKKIRRALTEGIETLKNKLAGVITCPACSFEFIVADTDFDVEKGKVEVVDKEKEFVTYTSRMNDIGTEIEAIDKKQAEIKNSKRALDSDNNDWKGRLLTADREVHHATYELDDAKRMQQHISTSIHQLQDETDGILMKVFDEAFGIIDECYKANERNKKVFSDEMKALESSIDTLRNTIKELEEGSGSDILASLKQSLKEYRKKATFCLSKKTKIEDEIGFLTQQEQNFVEFKTYLANSKIEALSKITNEFLENIGSDIRIKFSGYTVLKSGKVREKISVSLIRSGLDSGSFGKFSAGEAARVNLATILAMQKLVNGNCEVEKGLDLLVLDEILEAVDEDGLSNMFSALNNLNITSLVVSHGNIAESYPYKIKVIKENGESCIEI